ncbi:LptM family lipoprotein [Thiobacter aerophilum]|uniref:Glucose/Sorbosone dehydrogenase domain-containing protein n=1 Tax=Thiobacter aerophilum TaxID=3121275 RepID=A0ABV0EC46_9BURK
MQLMKKAIGNILAGLLVFGLIGCGQSGQDTTPPKIPDQNGKTTQPATLPAMAESSKIEQNEGDVRKLFIAQPKPLLDHANQRSILASSQKKLKPMALVKEVDYPKSLVFARDGTLYFIGDHEDAIVALAPDGKSKVIARSGVMGYVTPDDKTEREPVYNTFAGLSISEDGNLLTLRNGAYPFEINITTGEAKFLGFALPDGTQIKSISDFDSVANPSQWTFKEIYWFQGKVLLHTAPYFSKERSAVESGKWFSISHNGTLKPVNSHLELLPFSYLRVFGSLTPDGYIYAAEEGMRPDEPDRVVRIGDPGQSSLRKDATRVTIAEFKHGELTGALAFSPKGDLAVGAKNAIYLISRSAKK